MKQKLVIGFAVYAIFFAAVALSTGGPGAKVMALVVLSLGACFWLVFSAYRITRWIKHTGRQPRREPTAVSNYPHWFARFALDEDSGGSKRRPMGLIDTI